MIPPAGHIYDDTAGKFIVVEGNIGALPLSPIPRCSNPSQAVLGPVGATPSKLVA
jgi:hypothetical protein